MEQPILSDRASWIQQPGRRHSSWACLAAGSLIVFTYVVALGATLQPAVEPAAIGLAATSDPEVVTLTDLISNPDAMFAAHGFVSIPVLCVSLKGVFTFGLQTLFFLGSASFGSWHEKKAKMDADMKFSKLSISFQVLGQASATYSYVHLAIVTSFWQGWENWAKFAFLASQHNATITILVGLANNYVVKVLMPPSCERTIARILLGTGFVIGIPVWLALISACLSLDMILAIFAIVISFFIHSGDLGSFDLINADDLGPIANWNAVGWLSVLLLAVLWFIFGMWFEAWHAFLLLGATVVEMFIPCLLILLFVGEYLDVRYPSPFVGMLGAFLFALALSYFVTMLIPTCLLDHESGTRLGDASIQVFWGKKIGKYFSYTFLAPAQHTVEELRKNYAVTADLISSWLSQFLAFFS